MMELITTKKLPSQNTWLWLKVWGCTDSTFMLRQAESERPHKFYTTVEPRLHLYNHQTQLHWELVKWFYWNSILNTSPTCHGMQGTSERNQSKQRACIPGMKASGTQSDLQTKNTLLSCLIARCEVQGKFWLLQTVLFICNLRLKDFLKWKTFTICMHVCIWQWPTRLQSHMLFFKIWKQFWQNNLSRQCKKQLLLSLQLSWQTKVMHSSFHSRTTSNHSIDDAPSD